MCIEPDCRNGDKIDGKRIDKCMLREVYQMLCSHVPKDWRPVACCCGHGRYQKTIILRNDRTGDVTEHYSGLRIPRKAKFYKQDAEGFYYIPELEEKAID